MKSDRASLSLRAGLGIELLFTAGLFIAVPTLLPSLRPPESSDLGGIWAIATYGHQLLIVGLVVFVVWWSGTPLRHMGIRWSKRGLFASAGCGLLGGLLVRGAQIQSASTYEALVILGILAYFLCRASELGLRPDLRIGLVSLCFAARYLHGPLPSLLPTIILMVMLTTALTLWRNLPGLFAGLAIGLMVGQAIPQG